MNREHAEDSFEANNCNSSKVRIESHNTIVQPKTQAKSIDLSRTAHPQFITLNLRHDLDVHYQPVADLFSHQCRRTLSRFGVGCTAAANALDSRFFSGLR